MLGDVLVRSARVVVSPVLGQDGAQTQHDPPKDIDTPLNCSTSIYPLSVNIDQLLADAVERDGAFEGSLVAHAVRH